MVGIKRNNGKAIHVDSSAEVKYITPEIRLPRKIKKAYKKLGPIVLKVRGYVNCSPQGILTII